MAELPKMDGQAEALLTKLKDQLTEKQLSSPMRSPGAEGVTLEHVLEILMVLRTQSRSLRHLGLSDAQSTLTKFIEDVTGWGVMAYAGQLYSKLYKLSEDFEVKKLEVKRLEVIKQRATKAAFAKVEVKKKPTITISMPTKTRTHLVVRMADIVEYTSLPEKELKLLDRLAVEMS